MLRTVAGIAAGISRPANSAAVAPTGMRASQTLIDANAGQVEVLIRRGRLRTARRSPTTVALSAGHATPEGRTARAMRPEGATDRLVMTE